MSLFTYVNILWIFYDFISLRHLIAHFPPSKHSSSSSFIFFVSTARLTERWTNGARRDSRWNSNKKREESSRDSLIRSVTDEWANVSTAAESDEDDEVRTSMWWKNQKPIKNTWELRDAFSHPLSQPPSIDSFHPIPTKSYTDFLFALLPELNCLWDPKSWYYETLKWVEWLGKYLHRLVEPSNRECLERGNTPRRLFGDLRLFPAFHSASLIFSAVKLDIEVIIMESRESENNRQRFPTLWFISFTFIDWSAEIHALLTGVNPTKLLSISPRKLLLLSAATLCSVSPLYSLSWKIL